MYRDLREFLAMLEERGELRVFEDADPHLEIGTLAELNYERRGPALLFDRIKGYPAGYRIVTNLIESRQRTLLTLGLSPDLDEEAGLDEYERIIQTFQPVPPTVVSDGPIYQNVFTGDEVDLDKFPTPLWHEADGGCYIGTGCMVIMRDPESGVVNCGTYRVQLHDKRTAGVYITPHKTGAVIEKRWWERGKSCPAVIVFGEDPLLFAGSASYLAHTDLPEYELMGHFRGAPIEVVTEEITGLPMPAYAEIAIAGEIPPPDQESKDEGPLGEWTGYYASGTRPEPIIHARALYHRHDPIMVGMPPVRPRGNTTHFGLPVEEKNYKRQLQRAGVEDVLGVCRLSTPGVIVIQIRQRYAGHAMKAALALVTTYLTRFVIVVDEDVNPHNLEEVLWAVGTRCDPETAMEVIRGCNTSVLDPQLPPEQRSSGRLAVSKAIINACRPYHWRDQFPRVNVASPELRARVLQKWGARLG
jgi:4-hydroxy-3-polyprenylbenzoate decarboxylase